VILAVAGTLTGCAYQYPAYQQQSYQRPPYQQSQQGYGGYCVPPEWVSVMKRLPYKFAIHMADGKNYVIRMNGHSEYQSYQVLQFAMNQRSVTMEVWMSAILKERVGYDQTIKEFMRSRGYISTKCWEYRHREGKIYKMKFSKRDFSRDTYDSALMHELNSINPQFNR